jgi:hypothetical protein
MKTKPLTLVPMLLATYLMICFTSFAQTNTPDLIKSLQGAENKAREKGKWGEIKPNVADIVLNKSNIPSARTGPLVQVILASTVSGGEGAKASPIPSATRIPGNLVVWIDGTYPATSYLRWSVPADGQKHFPPQGYNDTASSIEVPIGMSGKICEHDGGNGDYGNCRTYGAGTSFVGDDLNDRGTSFWANDQGSYFYLTTADDEVPSALDVGVTYTATTDGTNGQVSVTLKINRDWYTKNYSIPLPTYCAHPEVFESTKANKAEWTSTISGGVLNIELKVQRHVPTTPNNWVGVGVRCNP